MPLSKRSCLFIDRSPWQNRVCCIKNMVRWDHQTSSSSLTRTLSVSEQTCLHGILSKLNWRQRFNNNTEFLAAQHFSLSKSVCGVTFLEFDIKSLYNDMTVVTEIYGLIKINQVRWRFAFTDERRSLRDVSIGQSFGLFFSAFWSRVWCREH